MRESKRFFFEKKNQKSFAPCRGVSGERATAESKVFCFFFSKKKAFFLPMITRSDIIWLGVSSGVTGGLVGGLMLGVGLAMMIEHINIGLLLIIPGAPASGLIGWLLSRRLANQLEP